MIATAADDCGPANTGPSTGQRSWKSWTRRPGEVIEEAGRPGSIIFTNLTRRLMPTLRYPPGTSGSGSNRPGRTARKFLLLGRSEEMGAHRRGFSHAGDGYGQAAGPFRDRFQIQQFQLVVTQDDLRDSDGAARRVRLPRRNWPVAATHRRHDPEAKTVAGRNGSQGVHQSRCGRMGGSPLPRSRLQPAHRQDSDRSSTAGWADAIAVAAESPPGRLCRRRRRPS